MKAGCIVLLICILAFTPAWVRAQPESPQGLCDFDHHKRSALLDLMLKNDQASVQTQWLLMYSRKRHLHRHE